MSEKQPQIYTVLRYYQLCTAGKIQRTTRLDTQSTVIADAITVIAIVSCFLIQIPTFFFPFFCNPTVYVVDTNYTCLGYIMSNKSSQRRLTLLIR